MNGGTELTEFRLGVTGGGETRSRKVLEQAAQVCFGVHPRAAVLRRQLVVMFAVFFPVKIHEAHRLLNTKCQVPQVTTHHKQPVWFYNNSLRQLQPDLGDQDVRLYKRVHRRKSATAASTARVNPYFV